MFFECIECGETAATVKKTPCMGCKSEKMTAAEKTADVEKEVARTSLNEDEKAFSIQEWSTSKCSIIPHAVARSGLFSIKQGELESVINKEISCMQKNIKIEFTGQILTQEHFRAWQACLNGVLKHRNYKYISRISELKKMARIGSNGNERFNTILDELTMAKVTIKFSTKKTKTVKYVGSLLLETMFEEKGKVMIHVSNELTSILTDNQHSIINLNDNAILKTNLAKKLHSLVLSYSSTQKKPTYTTVLKLYEISGSAQKLNKDGFKKSLKNAFNELIDKGLIKGFRVEDTRVTFWRK